MMDFIENDEELALVIGHELAHNTCKHIEKTKMNVSLGRLIGAVLTGITRVDMRDAGEIIGSGAFSQEFEAEADYMGAYYAARSGFGLSNAANFWRRMALKNPRAIHLRGSTHPSTAKRFLTIKKTLKEIQIKQDENLPLVPNVREAKQRRYNWE